MKVKMYIDLDKNNIEFNKQMIDKSHAVNLYCTNKPGRLYGNNDRIAFTIDVPDYYFEVEQETLTIPASDVEVTIKG